MLVWLLIGCSFMLMLLRIGLPYGIKSEGSVIATVTLTYREKLLLHRTNLYALGALLVLSAIGKWFPTTLEVVIIFAAPPKFLDRSVMLWLRRRLSLIVLMALFGVSLLFLLTACGEGPDASGLNSANQSNLTGVPANGAPMTQQQLNTAKSNEPFAYN